MCKTSRRILAAEAVLLSNMSNFIVSARKYRPQRFEDVVGQQHVAGTLKNALATDHVAHAFLFTGPRGVGKTTCARILAKVLNCENPSKEHDACNQCSSCTAFNENASFNIIELDAASNNSVEHIRALIEQVRFPPQQGRYKVFIIDEVHMLSQAAFNAFLKTLEEPPPYAIFILATTEKHKIIPTILSRCQIFDFRRITVGDMVLHLKNICQKEGITAEEDALHIIAQKADGALRDALSIFDRITSSSRENIRYEDVIENLNVLDYDYYFQITDALLAEDLPALLNLFDQILRKGFEPDVFVNGLAEHLRNLLVCKDEATLALLEVGEGLRERYRRQASLAPASFLLTGLNLANECDVNFRMARHKRLHVEMALIKMCHIGRAVKAAGMLQEKKTTDGASQPLNPAPKPAPAPLPAETGNAQALSPQQMSSLSVDLRLGLRKADKVALKLEAFEQAVQVEEAERAARTSRVSLENAQEEWLRYAESARTPTLRQAMQSADLRLEDKTIVARLGSTVFQGYIRDEGMRLLDYLRQQLHDVQVKIKLELDEAKQAEIQAASAASKPLTVKEKFDKMREINPLVNDLIQRFDLKLDE